MLLLKKKSAIYQKTLNEATEASSVFTSVINELSQDRYLQANTETRTYTETLTGTSASIGDTVTICNAEQNSPALSADDSINVFSRALQGKYRILAELGGGGMSRVFLAENIKIGNKWLIKYVDKKTGDLTGEEHILKLLNHINLPQIVDIFHDKSGVFIVETYIEGVSLDKILKSGRPTYVRDTSCPERNQDPSLSNALTKGQMPPQTIVIEWMEQIAQVLHYLHSREPAPVIHCDLKPSNIIITHNNRPVLIDFGISRIGTENRNLGATFKYAAPEQLKGAINEKHMDIIRLRFGELPSEQANWDIDERTDIYSMGVLFFELLTGELLTINNFSKLYDFVPREIAGIIRKCTMINPKDRYNSCAELLRDIGKTKNTGLSMMRFLTIRKIISRAAVLIFLFSSAMLTGGAYFMRQENLSDVFVSPEVLLISEQQTAEIAVIKHKPNGDSEIIDMSRITWNTANDNIARIEGKRIAGLNEGETEVSGRYRNKIINVKIKVTEPIDGIVDISLWYNNKNTVSLFAGSGKRETSDGELTAASFVSPESIDISDSGDIYITDAGKIRVISDGTISTIPIEPKYITARMLRCYGEDLYVLTNEWEDDDGMYYGFIQLTDGVASGIYISNAVYTRISDFAIYRDKLYFIEYNAVVRASYVKSIDLRDGSIYTHIEIPIGVTSMCISENGRVYLADSERAVIEELDIDTGALTYIAGVEGQKSFIDGTIPLFYEPLRIKTDGEKIYVLDFNVIRVIDISLGVLNHTETVAGEVSTEINPETKSGPASETVFAKSSLMDFAVSVSDKGVLLTDPKKSVIWELSERRE